VKYLLDSNILIYAARPTPAYATLRQWVQHPDAAVSALSQVEVLGFHRLEAQDELFLRLAFAALPPPAISAAVLGRAVWVRQQFRLKTPDAIIAATALEHGLTLVTADQGFANLPGLPVIDPLAAWRPPGPALIRRPVGAHTGATAVGLK